MRVMNSEDGLSRRHVLRGAGLCVLTVAMTVGLSACGKRSRPKPPSGDEAPYPYTYPSE